MNEEAAAARGLAFDQELHSLIAAAPGWPAEVAAAVAKILDAGGGSWPLALALMVVVGFAGERLVCWRLDRLNRTIAEQRSDRWGVVCGYAVLRVLFDLAAVILFGAFAWVALYFGVDGDTAVYRTLEVLLVAIVTFRVCFVLARAVLAPRSEGIRPVALSNDDARAFHRWAVGFIAAYALVVFLRDALVAAIATPALGRATVAVNGLVLVSIVVVFVWRNRLRLERLFAARPRPGEQPSTLRALFSQSWPFMVMAWLLILWVNWAYAVLTDDLERQQSTSISWWITLLFPVADCLVHATLVKISGLEVLKESGFEARRERFVSLVQTCVRVILAVVALAALAVTWNVAGTSLIHTESGQRVIWAAVDIGLTVLVAYMLYEVVMSMLDRYMPDEPEPQTGPEGEFQGEVGGAGASRQETLAPLLRGVFVVLLVLVVVLSVLSSLGVQILPLIAGAGIIGLAIGFGSQKLVQDVISGVFFLVDDAFRRGEYIDVGSVKGTVEKISVRSLQLRHHMGALHTIPFGEIRHLTNYSRDWVMMKLKLRLPYDTDVERVRKMIKKLGQQLLEDEELGPKFLQPLKSQGVYSMEDDSAMILRVKFMTRPGDQFEVRKTVYARIRELFEREGVEFAHRVVSVRLDGADPASLSEGQKRQVAGAALAARNEAST